MGSFQLDPLLAQDSEEILDLGLCKLRLNNDQRWPWLVLVPQKNGLEELFDLSLSDQQLLASEISKVAFVLKQQTGATKINIGALGNIVRQLHIHVIARFEGDANWPHPVWGHGKREIWQPDAKTALIQKIRDGI